MTEPTTDQQLLREFVQRGSERAFESLVQRHVDLVFATAVRRVTDVQAAQEITQNVILALSRKAAWLGGQAALAGWLHKTALLEARQWWGGEFRRRRREQTAVELGTTMKDENSPVPPLAGVLDEGLLRRGCTALASRLGPGWSPNRRYPSSHGRFSEHLPRT